MTARTITSDALRGDIKPIEEDINDCLDVLRRANKQRLQRLQAAPTIILRKRTDLAKPDDRRSAAMDDIHTKACTMKEPSLRSAYIIQGYHKILKEGNEFLTVRELATIVSFTMRQWNLLMDKLGVYEECEAQGLVTAS